MKVALREIVQTIVLALIIFFVLRAIVQNHQVVGISMEPSLHNGQFLLVNKAAYWFGDPQRGDIIVLRNPAPPPELVIKRIVGLPGESVEIRDGDVYLDGSTQRLDEPYLTQPHTSSFPARRIEQGHYFVLGDNRNVSLDSRRWGTVPADAIVGKAWVIIWPLGDWGFAPNYRWEAGERSELVRGLVEPLTSPKQSYIVSP